MPPAPSGDSISYGPNFVPEASATISESIPQDVGKSAGGEEPCSVVSASCDDFREEHFRLRIYGIAGRNSYKVFDINELLDA
jgi:hypothetical protein